MVEREHAALDEYALVARVLHEVQEVDCRMRLLEVEAPSPILPFAPATPQPGVAMLLLPAEAALQQAEGRRQAAVIPVLESDKMGEMMPRVRRLAALDPPALALDVRHLAQTPPFGQLAWRPRTREDLAELRAAAGCPLWILGVHSAGDAEVAAEAGLEGVVVHGALGSHLGGPAAIEVLPEVIDAVAGMTGVYAAGPVRSGIDVFRYLAVGAEAVVVESDRAPAALEAELRYAMRLTGCRTLADIGYESIYEPLFREL